MFKHVPNILTMLRFVLIPFIFIAIIHSDYVLAFILLTLSGITDILDGFIARKFNFITNFGKLIDPIADKLTQFTIAITLLFTYPLAWVLLIIIVLKDGMLGIVGLYLYDYGLKIKGASWWGKIATAYFYFVVIILIGYHIPDTFASQLMIITSSALMLLSFVLYAKELKQMIKEKDKLVDEQKRN